MRPVLSREEARAFDQSWIGRGVPGLVLMENAGRGAADRIIAQVLGGDVASQRVVVLCGPGNNGGDGLVVARHLFARGVRVRVCLLQPPETYTGDALVNLRAFLATGQTVESELLLGAGDVVVDALFGTGLTRDLEGEAARFVAETRGHVVVALDIPSGIDANTGAVLGCAVRAQYTYTFGALKRGLVTDQALVHVGHLDVLDIGVPAPATGHVATLEARDLSQLLVPRAPAGHKYTHGHVLVVGGSHGTTGAAELSARGALRSGAGLVTRASLDDAESGLAEVMRVALPRGAALLASLGDLLAKKRALVVGPGLGRDVDAAALVQWLLAHHHGPMVLDADALRLLPSETYRGDQRILTPHTGELAHLLGVSSEAIDRDRFRALEEAVKKTGAVVVLKGARTLIGAPDGRIRVCVAGTPALGTAGSGDVLSGILGAFACTLPAFEAAQAGVLAHALVGEAWAATHGDRGLLASEIADGVPAVLRKDG